MKRIVILISGRGSNMQAILEVAKAEQWPVTIAAVISNRPNAGGLTTAGESGIATAVVDHQQYADRVAFDTELMRVIDSYRPDLVVLAGFMRILLHCCLLSQVWQRISVLWNRVRKHMVQQCIL